MYFFASCPTHLYVWWVYAHPCHFNSLARISYAVLRFSGCWGNSPIMMIWWAFGSSNWLKGSLKRFSDHDAHRKWTHWKQIAIVIYPFPLFSEITLRLLLPYFSSFFARPYFFVCFYRRVSCFIEKMAFYAFRWHSNSLKWNTKHRNTKVLYEWRRGRAKRTVNKVDVRR